MAKTLPPFQSFLDEHRAPVLSFLRSMVGPADADDCFQETFIAAMRAYEQLDGRYPRAWVMTIARRKAIDHHRARKRRPEPRAELPEQPTHDRIDSGGDPELWTAVAALAPKQRAAVAMRFAADMSYADVAEALACSQEAARRSVHEGLKRLRETAPISDRSDHD
ncbi:MAG: sigma-70 family RNA polymerase sigma factor [bacterium]